MLPILPTRAALLTARLGDIREWSLLVTCACRGFPKHVEMPPLADELGNARVLETVLARLRCGKCGRAPVRIVARRGDHLAAKAMTVVLLESKEAVGRNRG